MIRTTAAAAALALGVAASAHHQLALERDQEAEKLGYLRSEIDKLDREIAEVRKLPGEVAALAARNEVVEAVRRDRLQAVRLVDEVVRRRPPGVSLASLGFARSRAELHGYAASEKAVRDFMSALAASPQVAAVEALTTSASGAGRRYPLEFRFRAAMRRSAGGDK